jgi:predicted nucleic acid-binding protein
VARIFADTSALFKLYHAEPNSPAVIACVAGDDSIILSQITPLEFRSACYGLVRQGLISLQDAVALVARFDNDLSQYEMRVLENAVIQRAQALLDSYSVVQNLRPADALQVATALVEHAVSPIDAILTTDTVLITVANVEGLNVLP